MPAAISSVTAASSEIFCGTLSAGQSLPGGACRRVYLGAPTDNTPGGQVNTSDVMFGSATAQNDRISPDGSRDGVVEVDDASKITVRFVTGSDKLEYRIEY